MRLIDADALIEATDGISQDPTCPMHIAAEYYQYMTEAPTIEAEPVRHEKAIPHIIQLRNAAGKVVVEYQEGWECPFCGDPGVKNYCPNCGAKMDKEVKYVEND